MMPVCSMGCWLKLSPASKRASRAQLLAARARWPRIVSCRLGFEVSMGELRRAATLSQLAIHPLAGAFHCACDEKLSALAKLFLGLEISWSIWGCAQN